MHPLFLYCRLNRNYLCILTKWVFLTVVFQPHMSKEMLQMGKKTTFPPAVPETQSSLILVTFSYVGVNHRQPVRLEAEH